MNNKLKKIIVFFIILLPISSIIFGREIADLDEIWNYNTARAIAEGLIPYKDISMITTPLLPMINSIFLNFFANELITMRILAVLLNTMILFLIFNILEELKINRNLKIFGIIGIGYLYKEFFCIDYNVFVLFLTLLIIYFELKNNKNTNKFNFILGVLAGLCIITKQTTGILISAALVGEKIIVLIYKKILLKDTVDIKKEFKLISFRLLGILVPVIILLSYLLITKSIKDFLDYCILGIKTFSNKISYINLIKSEQIEISILSIMIPLSWIWIIFICIKNKDEKLFLFVCLSIAEFVVAFPISDNIHFSIGSTPSFICLIYILNFKIKDIEIKNKRLVFCIIETGVDICVILITVIGIKNCYSFIKQEKNYSSLNHFKYIVISESFEEEIKRVDEFIENETENVYILNFDAPIYMIPINRYNKDYDMFLKGNIGSEGEEGKIEDIKNENAKYLIIKEGISRNWQNPEIVREYIKTNLNKIGEIENFEIYEN